MIKERVEFKSNELTNRVLVVSEISKTLNETPVWEYNETVSFIFGMNYYQVEYDILNNTIGIYDIMNNTETEEKRNTYEKETDKIGSIIFRVVHFVNEIFYDDKLICKKS